jgi:hypothetical protein
MKTRFVAGILMLLAALATIKLWQSLRPNTPPAVLVEGYMGGSKVGLFSDPDVQRILSERYGLKVKYSTLGGREQVCGLAQQDFLWPGTEISVERYKACHNGTAKAESVLASPLVFYSWDVVTDALAREKLIDQSDAVYYVHNMPRLTRQLIEGREWSAYGLPMLYGRARIISTDPAKSNSGEVFAALVASMLLDGKIPDGSNIDRVLPEVKGYFDRLGYLQASSGELFKRFIRTGLGENPIMVAYESQLIDFVHQNQIACDQIKAIRVIYPQPTVWASHPFIAESPKGERLLEALKDPEIQRLGWERHGFRTGLGQEKTTSRPLSCISMPAAITSVMPLPRPDIMDRMIQYLFP